MKVCAKGHEYRGDENYRARQGWCPVCFREVQRRYDTSDKGRSRKAVYEKTEKGRARSASYFRTDKRADAKARYDQSPKGWLSALRKRRYRALERRKQRQEAEDLG